MGILIGTFPPRRRPTLHETENHVKKKNWRCGKGIKCFFKPSDQVYLVGQVDCRFLLHHNAKNKQFPLIFVTNFITSLPNFQFPLFFFVSLLHLYRRPRNQISTRKYTPHTQSGRR
ncbi:Schizosaccharomyces pombe specific protein [Schizosaccharomyces pombe]|uniref:Meiotically up-regulated gene 42 protein n=1 Tax=Schizosaccharomyces pombe (strain 972 / ATCC 24843) TaxID=284812 RepID=MUG42_SCHPO|nr:protein mug42 [Schizosaccharomyces pombe]Q09886.1 RecName: Full=Meiotically up-regulated gene 42 protein [Schizosaccharomyces pombe 972h-]CAB37425.1 sequence orphan [Schizosaccharomyces pombe]|eukprot:NP_588217.1 protein mug42 [Schizosaccharomyces pombe]